MNRSIHNSAGVSTRILRQLSEIQQIRSEWRDLFRRCKTTPFQSPDWLLSWIEVFSPEKLMCIEVRCGDQLVSLAPLLIYRREADQVLAFAGGGVSDYLDALIDPQFDSEAISAILLSVLEARDHWTVLDLTDLPSHSLLLKSELFKSKTTEHDVCSVLQLPENENELLHLFSKRQRANLRNAHSRLERAGGGSVEIATDENLHEVLSDLFALHSERWSERGEPGVLGDERIRRFHSIAAPCLLTEGMLQLSRLRSKDRTLSVIYSLFAGDTCFCYLQGFDPDFRQLSPGTQLMFSVIQNAVAAGRRNFDFLRGQESYKQHWRAESKPTYRIQLSRSSLAALLESSAEGIAA